MFIFSNLKTNLAVTVLQSICMKKFVVVAVLAFLFSCSHQQYDNPHVLINTNLGDIEIELYPSKAPKTVAAFVSYIEKGIYDNSSFYRVLKAEEFSTDFNTGLIQGGIWKTAAQKSKDIPGINHESTKLSGLTHTDGIISMARTDTGTAKTEFFICIGDQSPLDFGRRGTADGQGFAAFGKVFSGMNIVHKIQAQQSHGDAFDNFIVIKSITKL